MPHCLGLYHTWRWGLKARLLYRALLVNVLGLRYGDGVPDKDIGQLEWWGRCQQSQFFQVTYSLHLYSVNGRLRASLPLTEQPTALTVAEDFVLLGTAQCSLHILHLHR